MAFRYLSRAVYPLLICYGIYSLIYQEHKGWYSWVLSMLYGFLLTFGKDLAEIIENEMSFEFLIYTINLFRIYYDDSSVIY